MLCKWMRGKAKHEKLVDAVKSADTDNLAYLAAQGRDKAVELASQGRDWAAPRLEKAWKQTVAAAAPRIEAASEAASEKVDLAHEKLVGDYLPRVQRAMSDAATAAQSSGSLRDRADAVADATKKALTEPTKKGHPILKGLGLTVLAAAVGAAGYVLWRRSQPVEDPWAEEYWADLDAKTKEIDFEQEAAEAEERAEQAVADMDLKDPKEAAKHAKESAKETAKDVADDAQAAAEKASDKVKETAEEAAKKVHEAAEKAKNKMDK